MILNRLILRYNWHYLLLRSTLCLVLGPIDYQTMIARSWRARRIRDMATTCIRGCFYAITTSTNNSIFQFNDFNLVIYTSVRIPLLPAPEMCPPNTLNREMMFHSTILELMVHGSVSVKEVIPMYIQKLDTR